MKTAFDNRPRPVAIDSAIVTRLDTGQQHEIQIRDSFLDNPINGEPRDDERIYNPEAREEMRRKWLS